MSLLGFARIGVKFSTKIPHLFLDSISRVSKDLDNQQVANCVWSLGKIGVIWQSLSIKSQKSLGEAIVRTSNKMAPQGVANTIQGLSNMGVSWVSLPNYLKINILDSIKLTVNLMKEQELSNCISGLGRLGVDWESLPNDLRDLLYKHIVRSSHDLNCKGLAMTIHGLGKMNVNIHSLSKIFYDNIDQSIINLSDIINSQEISNIIYGLGRLGFTITSPTNKDDSSHSQLSLSSQASTLLLQALCRESWQLTSQGVANSLWGFMLMNGNWKSMPSKVQSSYISSLSRECKHMQEQELGNTIYALGKLGMNWNDLPVSVQVDVLESIEDRIPFMASVGVVMLLLGLGRLKLFWNELPDAVINMISEAISRVLQTANHQTTSILIHALASCEAKWDYLTPQLQITIEEAIARSHWDLQQSEKKLKISTTGPIVKTDKLISSAKSKTNKSTNLPKPIAAVKIPSITANTTASTHKKSTKKSKGSISSPTSPFVKTRPLNQLDQFLQSDSVSSYHLIFSLGQLGVKWDNLGYSTKEMLLSCILTSISSMNEHAVVNIFYGLSNMNMKWVDIRNDVRQVLLTSIVRISNDLIEQGLSSLVLSLAKLDVCYQTDLPDEVKLSIRKAISKQSHLGEHSLSSLLYGLGKMSRKWKDLHVDVRQTLKAAIVVCHIDGRITAEGIANSIYGLGLMSADWTTLSSSVKLALINDIMKTINDTTPTQLVNILLGLGKMGASLKSLPVKITDKLQYRLTELIPHMNEQHISNLCLALSSVGLSWFDLPQRSRDYLLNQIKAITRLNTDEYLHSLGLTMIIVGMSRLGLKWAYFSTDLADSINSLLERSVQELSTQQLASVLSSLGKMTWRWDNLSNSLRDKILTRITRLSNSKKIVLQDVSIIMNSLGSLGLTWDTLSGPLKVSVLHWIKNISRLGNASELAGLVYGLGLMDCSWDKLVEDTRKCLLDGIIRVTSTNNSPSGTDSIKPWTFKYIPSEFSSRGNFQLQPQSLANLMYGLSLMIFDVSDDHLIDELNRIHISLLDAVSSIGLLKFSQTEREQILIYAHLLQTVITLPQPLLQGHHTPNEFTVHSSTSLMSTSSSRLQESVVNALTNALSCRSDDLEVLSEYSAFNGCLPVDASIFRGNKPVAFLEVDGPQHFKGDSLSLRRKDLMKETLYRKKHPDAAFTRVRFDQVNKLGSRYVGDEVANFITIISAHTQNISENDNGGFVNRYIERELQYTLEGKYLQDSFRLSHSKTSDFVYADVEEDNS
eukprot:CAMPEP_0196763414 /NCGR_PEP_ID=MMETSP1095-20130614/4027_1 /TAXON_ID=96789 ORGANISM="Chromulina nebulosa, Strain UTEXLB2642" /NCGR_SAMPLE_ID=MMETSP1095 /ASSEMBLY_ACC=CAM_ASM_000446 /LENGTH=1257 /DNA_ID=CAMNT_0042116537 /DNA_START=544 /DNA_END=4317 /DNA_ORIENTATION=+